MPVKGGYLLAAGGGAILLWSGFKGKNWSSVLRSVVSGKNPSATLTAYPITTSPSAFTTPNDLGPGGQGVAAHASTTQTSSDIANDVLSKVGTGYVWAGAPAVGPNNHDCSSLVNEVIGWDLNLGIPGFRAGTYHGQTHGPNTVAWLAWTGAFTIKKADMAPGDLAIWQTHMGIIVGKNEMVSAQDQQLGTRRTTIKGGAPFGEVLFVRRLKAGR
jgi:cell wall-associated NlpC family hydrolase